MSKKPGRSKLSPPRSIPGLSGLFKMVRDVMLGRQDVLENRRGGVRLRVAFPVIAKVADQEYACETTDVSAAGVRLFFPNPLESGQQIRLSVPPEVGFIGKQRLLFKVKWCEAVPGRGYQLGLKFADTEENLEVSWLQDALRHFKLQEKANRKHRRIPAEVYAEVHAQDGSYIGKGICRNLSTGGAQLTFDRELTAGDILQIGMGPSDQETAITLLARVLVRQPTEQVGTYSHGLRFLKGDRRQHARLRSFLQTLLEEAQVTGQNLDESPEVTLPDVTAELEHREISADDANQLLAQANARGALRVERPVKESKSLEEEGSIEYDGPVPLGAPIQSPRSSSKSKAKSTKKSKRGDSPADNLNSVEGLDAWNRPQQQSPNPSQDALPLQAPQPTPDVPEQADIAAQNESEMESSASKLVRLPRQSVLETYEAAHNVEMIGIEAQQPSHSIDSNRAEPSQAIEIQPSLDVAAPGDAESASQAPAGSGDPPAIEELLSIDQLPHNSPKYKDQQQSPNSATTGPTIVPPQLSEVVPSSPMESAQARQDSSPQPEVSLVTADNVLENLPPLEPVQFQQPSRKKTKQDHQVRRSASLWAGRALPLESQRNKKAKPPKGEQPEK